jgi:hypothetical protein
MIPPSSTVWEMSQQDTNIDFQVAIIHFPVRNIVRTIAYFKLHIVTLQIFGLYMSPVQIRIGGHSVRYP